MNRQSVSDNQTFDKYIVSRSNIKAYTACIDLINNPGGQFIALYGANSYGKSHLLHATRNTFGIRYPTLTIKFTNYDDLISQYMYALHEGTHNAFVDELIKTDLLIIDNMQFVGGKNAIQEEIANWINRMVIAGKIVVIAFDRPIKHYDTLLRIVRANNADKCKVIEIKSSDCALKKKYLKRLLNEHQMDFPFIIKKYLVCSQKLTLSAMNGFLHKCLLLEKQKGTKLTISEIKNCLSCYIHKEA